MTPGSIYFHSNFRFHDSVIGQKIFIALGSISTTRFVVVKTTSQARCRSTAYGCHLSQKYPAFHFPVGSCCFKEPTWVCLDEYYELDAGILLTDKVNGLVKPVGDLDPVSLWDLATCAVSSDDVTASQADAIRKSVGIP